MKRRPSISIAILVLFFFLSLLSLDLYSNNSKDTLNLALAESIVNLESAELARPVRLQIPSIEVDASIESLGLTPLGAMDAPAVPENVGWYNQGTVPGKVGSAVMDGHSGWKNGKAVFDDLRKLEIGDKIYVQDKNNNVTIFVVRELKYYDKDANTKNVFESSDGKSHLNLITCAGEWDKGSQTSSQRLVVWSDLEIK